MKVLTSILSLLAISGIAAANNVEMSPIYSGAMKKMGFYYPQRLELSKDKPAGLKKEPATKNPTYGVVDLGGTKTIIILDDDKIYADTNGDGDLTNDPAADWKAQKQGTSTMYMGSIQVGLQSGRQRMAVTLGAYKFDKNDPGRAALANTLLYYCDYAFDGKITLGTKTYHAMLVDIFATGFKPKTGVDAKGNPVDSGVHLLIDVNANGKFDSRGENYDAAKPFNIGGTTYQLTNVSAMGCQVVKSNHTVAEVLPPPDLGAGKKAIAFNTKTTDGAAVSFPNTYHGKLVMLDFWATWCGPCKGEIPGLSKAYDRYHAQGFEVLGISLDNEETAKGLGKFTKDWNMPWPQVCDAKYWNAEVAQLYVVQSIPAAFLVDGDTGEILASGNELRGELLVPTLEKALAKKKGAIGRK